MNRTIVRFSPFKSHRPGTATEYGHFHRHHHLCSLLLLHFECILWQKIVLCASVLALVLVIVESEIGAQCVWSCVELCSAYNVCRGMLWLMKEKTIYARLQSDHILKRLSRLELHVSFCFALFRRCFFFQFKWVCLLVFFFLLFSSDDGI